MHAAAHQVAHNDALPAGNPLRDDAYCYHLNNGFANGNFSLWDEEDPSAGVVLTYGGGNKCGTKADGTINRRSLRSSA